METASSRLTGLARSPRRVVIGGTFDVLHRGHKELIDRAFREGDFVLIGLTVDEFAERLHGHPVNPYEERLGRLKSYLRERGLLKRARIVPINDYFGPSVDRGDLCVIVVSEETLSRAIEINDIRRRRGLPPLRVVCIPMVLAQDGAPISSTRIREGAIDQEGNILGHKTI